MSEALLKLQLGFVVLMTIVFLWATMPAQAQDLRVCGLIMVPPKQQPLGPNRMSPLAPSISRHIA